MNANPSPERTAFEALRAIVAQVAAIHPEAVHSQARLVEELGMDSLNAAEVGVAAAQAGLLIDQDAWWSSRTFGDLVKAIRT